jgi:hypothetical protein
VLVFTAVAFLVTWLFDANVDEQGGAYATGVLVLITSAAFAVTLSARRRRQRARTVAFAVITAVFAYTTVVNIVERPEGVKIGGCFVAGILIVSFASRILEITRTDTSDFENALHVTGERRHGYRVPRVSAPTVPNAIAATLLAIRDRTTRLPHVYFEWTEGNPA